MPVFSSCLEFAFGRARPAGTHSAVSAALSAGTGRQPGSLLFYKAPDAHYDQSQDKNDNDDIHKVA